jgi:hypothetical protein
MRQAARRRLQHGRHPVVVTSVARHYSSEDKVRGGYRHINEKTESTNAGLTSPLCFNRLKPGL